MNSPAIEFRGVTRAFGNTVALDRVDLTIGRGEVLGLLGRNGAGKTTALRLAHGVLHPDQGSIRVLGEDPWNNPALAVRLGYCPEHDGFYETLTGRAFVTAVAGLRGARNAKSLADEAIERVKLTEVCNRKISTYSRGMRQRLKIAQALANGPELLILDEPLTGCDPIVRAELITLIRSFPEEGRSVIVSSHVLHEVEKLTSRIVLIHRGRLVADGDVQDIRALMNRHPHVVRVAADRPRDLGAALAREEEVVEVKFEEGLLYVRTREPEKFYKKLPAIALAQKCGVREISSPDDNMEAVFRYLTE